MIKILQTAIIAADIKEGSSPLRDETSYLKNKTNPLLSSCRTVTNFSPIIYFRRIKQLPCLKTTQKSGSTQNTLARVMVPAPKKLHRWGLGSFEDSNGWLKACTEGPGKDKQASKAQHPLRPDLIASFCHFKRGQVCLIFTFPP